MRLTNGMAVLLGVAISATGTAARAQAPTGGDKVTAEALFEEARKLVAEGKSADACPKFADSERLDPSPATLLNLASCWERVGRTATAWATYREAASAADASGRRDYVTAAQRHAEALAPRLTRLSLNVGHWVEGIQIRRDGILVGRAEWGSPLPVDAGPHTLAASAPGFKDWGSTIDVQSVPGQVMVVTVPALEAAPPEPAKVAEAQSPPTASGALVGERSESASLPPTTAVESHGSSQRIAAWITGGAGVVAAAIGAGFAVAAKNKDNDSLSHCNSTDKNLCDQVGVQRRDDARTDGDVATVALAVAAAAVAGGVILWVTAPPTHSKSEHAVGLYLAPAGAGGVLGGTWQ